MARRIVSVGEPSPLLQVAARALGLAVETVRPAPRHLAGEDRKIRRRFQATPDALVASWEAARSLEDITQADDEIFVSDRGGLAGVYALAQCASQEPARVVVVAGDGLVARQLAVYGSLVEANAETTAIFDWEMATMRWADEVVTPVPAVVALLSKVGIPVRVLDVAPRGGGHRVAHPRSLRLPERVGRAARTMEMLRGLVDYPGEVVVSAEDQEDLVWAGTTWEANGALVTLFGDRLRRTGTGGDVHVLGDLLGVPPSETVDHVSGGGGVIVPALSLAAAWWPEAPVWTTSDDLPLLLEGGRVPRSTIDVPVTIGARVNGDRARRVSVGVPVFQDTRFLDECLESVTAQTQAPHEVIVYDDGSRSTGVDGTLQAWAARGITVMRGPNRGVCVARNRMLEAMTGDTFVFVDADDLLAPTFIERCATVLRNRLDTQAVATWTEFFGAYEAIEAKPPFDDRTGRRENTIVSTCVLVDMMVRDQGIRFSPDLAFIYCEDWDFWAQIVGTGGSIGLVPEPLARHRVHPSSGGFKRLPLATEIGKARATGSFTRR